MLLPQEPKLDPLTEKKKKKKRKNNPRFNRLREAKELSKRRKFRPPIIDKIQNFQNRIRNWKTHPKESWTGDASESRERESEECGEKPRKQRPKGRERRRRGLKVYIDRRRTQESAVVRESAVLEHRSEASAAIQVFWLVDVLFPFFLLYILIIITLNPPKVLVHYITHNFFRVNCVNNLPTIYSNLVLIFILIFIILQLFFLAIVTFFTFNIYGS